ncbi:olfactory receptor 14C36-like [Protobothrops mucrosquamatus]|uniref:olfactory receptor 14C36-like n=1 Tax=Protobothrops mucrosquamatus TaxID=103944 RepID=UPI0010FBB229|nr:olfactory receptor 14C36-like [Protobothrops mucrosquamatus]
MHNVTSEFLLWEFSKIWELQLMYIVSLLLLYVVTITENLLIITAIVWDHHLHTPMYFFLINLPLQDIASVSVIIPKVFLNFLMNVRTISYSGCIAQVLFFFFFLGSDIPLLTVMAYDRYIAICKPLQYEMIMNRKVCTKMVGTVWIDSLLNASLHTNFTFITPLCSNIVNQFYCEVPYLLKIACFSSYVSEIGVIIFSATLRGTCFVFLIVTYVHAFSAVLRIPSVEGRKKAFSTCLPHIIVFFVFVFTASFAYLKPISDSPLFLDFIITITYSIVPSMLNPVIYSLRIKDIKVTLSRLFGQKLLFFKEE